MEPTEPSNINGKEKGRGREGQREREGGGREREREDIESKLVIHRQRGREKEIASSLGPFLVVVFVAH